MRTYLADCDLPGMTPEQLRGTEARIQRACEQAAAAGDAIRYLRAIWVPGDWRVMYLFQARGVAAVEAVCRAAQVPFLRIVDAVDRGVGEHGTGPAGG
jgi:muconolactone delta-isomerase